MADNQPPIIAELPDGTTLEFEAGTADDVIDRVVKSHLSKVQDGVDPSFERRINAGEFNAPPAPEGPRPGSLADRTRQGFEKLFGGFGGQMQDAAAAGLRLSPLGLTTSMIEGGAPAGGMVGGTAGAALGGPLAGVGGATVGGGVGGAMRRWWQGEPTSGGDVALDTVGQGALQAAGAGAGAAMQAMGAPILRGAIGASQKLYEKFPKLAETAMREGIPVGKRLNTPFQMLRTGKMFGEEGADTAKRMVTESRNKALALPPKADAAGAARVTAPEVVPSLDPAFAEARLRGSLGGYQHQPFPKLIDRGKALAKTFGGKGKTVTETKQLQEALQREGKAVSVYDKAAAGEKVTDIEGQAIADVEKQLRQIIEDRVKKSGVGDIGAQNAQTQELLGLFKAYRKEQLRRTAQGAKLPKEFGRLAALPITATVGRPGFTSRLGIGLDRVGSAEKTYSPMVNALRALVQSDIKEPY